VKRMAKRLIGFLLAALMISGITSVTAFAESTSLSSVSNKSYIAMKNGYYYLVADFSDTENILIQLGKKGPNKLFEIIRVSFADAKLSPEEAISNGGWTLYESYTDHFGPYGIIAENGYEEFTGTFTGGNHGYENTGDTSVGTKNTATARCVSLNVYADDILLTEGNGTYADTVTFDWVNAVQAANTKLPDGSGREVLNEHYTMVFDGKQFNIQNDITALENITITPYYGNQAVVGWATDGIKYVGNDDDKWYSAAAQHNSGNQTCSSYIAKKGVYHMQTSYDPTYGLGKGEHFGTSPSVMIEAYGKGYFNFFKDNCFVPAGTTHSYRGSYRYFYSDGSDESWSETVNYALGKTYNASVATTAAGDYMDAIRMDTNNAELTDGIVPSADYWNDYGWVHWIGTSPEIVVDLGQNQIFDTFEVVALSHFSADGFILPQNVKISVSGDNFVFSEVATVGFPDSSTITSATSYELSYTHASKVKGRYVKFSFPEGWNLIGEIRVLGIEGDETFEDEIVSSGKTYNVSAATTADGSYMDAIRMDTNNAELTDGIIPFADYWNDYGWVHWIGKSVDITVDLQKTEIFNKFEVTALSHFSADGFILPSDVTFFVSNDNVSWTQVSKEIFPDSTVITTPTAYTISYQHNKALNARYVKFHFPEGWNIIGEVKVIKTGDLTSSDTYYTVSGNVKEFGTETDDVTITLASGEEEVSAVADDSGNYTFNEVVAGTYTLKASKPKHAPREYEIEVSDTDVTLDVEIRLYGDVTGDGVINNTDVLQINRKNANFTSVFDAVKNDEYIIKVANVTAITGIDTIINNTDVLQINRKNANFTSVFDRIA